MNPPATLYAYDVHSDGRSLALQTADAPRGPETAYRWLHFDLNEAGVADWITTAVDPIVAEALTREDTRPRCSPHGDGLIVILRGVNLNPNSDPEDMVSVRLWIEPGLILSTRVRRLMAITGLNEAMKANQAPLSTGAFIASLAAGLTERMDPVVSELADRIDALEEASVDRTEGMRAEIADIRRTTIALRRYIAP